MERDPSLTQEQVKRLDFDAMVNLGRKLVSKLPLKFREENRGKFVAVGLKSGKVLAIKDSLDSMNQELAVNRPNEDYYLEHLGFEYVTEFK